MEVKYKVCGKIMMLRLDLGERVKPKKVQKLIRDIKQMIERHAKDGVRYVVVCGDFPEYVYPLIAKHLEECANVLCIFDRTHGPVVVSSNTIYYEEGDVIKLPKELYHFAV